MEWVEHPAGAHAERLPRAPAGAGLSSGSGRQACPASCVVGLLFPPRAAAAASERGIVEKRSECRVEVATRPASSTKYLLPAFAVTPDGNQGMGGATRG